MPYNVPAQTECATRWQAKVLADVPLRHAVYASLTRLHLCLYEDAYQDVIKDWGLDGDTIYRLGLVSVPTYTLNLLACYELASRFEDLGDVPGFYQLRGCWRLDLDEKLSRKGLLLPIHDRRMQITTLRVFRHTRDCSPFILRTRTERLEIA